MWVYRSHVQGRAGKRRTAVGSRMAIFLILAFNVVIFTGVNAARIIFSLYTLNLGGNEADVGAIMATLYLFPLLLSWPIGVLSDRYSPRWLLAGGTTIGACGALVPYFFPVLASLYVAAGLLVSCRRNTFRSTFDLLQD